MLTIIEIFIVGWVALLIGIILSYFIWYRTPKKKEEAGPDSRYLEKAIAELPSKVLQSITSSNNTHKGALGELVAHLKLRADYDRIVPLGSIVDFIGIIFPKEGEPGRIDFCDIKTGDSARLSKDQKELRKIIDNKNIKFVKFKVETIDDTGLE